MPAQEIIISTENDQDCTNEKVKHDLCCRDSEDMGVREKDDEDGIDKDRSDEDPIQEFIYTHEEHNVPDRMNKADIIARNQNREYFCYACRYSCSGVRQGRPNSFLQRSFTNSTSHPGRQQYGFPQVSSDSCQQPESQYCYVQQDCCQQNAFQQQCCPQCPINQGNCYSQCSTSSSPCCPQPVCYCYQSGGQARLISRQVYCCPGGSCCLPTCTVQPCCSNPCSPPCAPSCCSNRQAACCAQQCCSDNPCSTQCCNYATNADVQQQSCCCNYCCPPPPCCGRRRSRSRSRRSKTPQANCCPMFSRPCQEDSSASCYQPQRRSRSNSPPPRPPRCCKETASNDSNRSCHPRTSCCSNQRVMQQGEDCCSVSNSAAASDITDPNFVSYDYDNCDTGNEAIINGGTCPNIRAADNICEIENDDGQEYYDNADENDPNSCDSQPVNNCNRMNKQQIIHRHQDKEYFCYTCRQSCGGVGGGYPDYNRQRRVNVRGKQCSKGPQDNCPASSPRAENCQPMFCSEQDAYQEQQGCCQGQCCPDCTLQSCPCPEPTCQYCPSGGQARLVSRQVYCCPGGSGAGQQDFCGQGQGNFVVTPQVNCCPAACCQINNGSPCCQPLICCPQMQPCCGNGCSSNFCNACNSDLVVAIDNGPVQNPCQTSCGSCNCPTVQLCCGPITSCQPAPCPPCPCSSQPPCSCCCPPSPCCCCQPCSEPCCSECPPCPCRPPGWYVSGYQPFAFYNCLIGYNCTFEMRKRKKIIKNGVPAGTGTAPPSRASSTGGPFPGDPDTEGDFDPDDRENDPGEDSPKKMSTCVVTCNRKVTSQCNACCPSNCIPRKCVSYSARCQF